MILFITFYLTFTAVKYRGNFRERYFGIIGNKNLQAQAKKPEITEAEELDEDSIDESGLFEVTSVIHMIC